MQKYKLKIKDFPLDERPREKLIKIGSKSLSNAELLAIILRTGNKKENVLELSKRLINKYNIKSLSRISINTLMKSLGIGQTKACQIAACFELGRRLASFRDETKPIITTSKDVFKIIMPELSNLKKEHFIGLYLDARKRIIKKETIFIGSLDTNIIHPREIFKIALAESAAAIILIHNHPSGDPTPSQEDIEITKQIIEAGEIIGIQVLDHIIIGDKNYKSLKEKGYC